MTDFANLVISVDARQPKDAKAELDRLAAAGDKAGKSADNLGRAWVKASSDAGKLRLEQISARMEADKLASSQRNVVVSMDKSSGSSRMLAMQLSQVAQQAAVGTNVLQALAIQLPDIAGGMALAGGSAGRFASFLGGPWGIAIASAAAVLVPFITRLYDTANAADTATGALQDLINKRREEIREQNKVVDSQRELNKLYEKRLILQKQVESGRGATANNRYQSSNDLFRTDWQKQLLNLNQQILESEDAIRAEQGKRAEATAKTTAATEKHTAAIGRGTKAVRSYGAAFKDATKEIELNAAALRAVVYESFGDSDKLAKQFEEDLAKKVNTELEGMRNGVTTVNEAWTDWNAELRNTIDLLDRMGSGKLGNIGAAIVGLTSGDFSGVRGKAGALAQLLNTTWRDAADDRGPGAIHILRDEIVSGLDKVFGDTGSFAKTMNNLLRGAGTGAAIGGIAFGGGGGALGGSIGGALGQAVGGKLFGSLGAAAGPLGAIAGSLLGGLVGSLFSSVKKGVATFSGTGLVSTSGNSKSRIAGATSAGNSAIDALAQIADAFGADIGDASFSLGIRKKNYVLDPTGQGRTKGAGVLNFGQDSEAAIKAAIKDAISDGVFEGLSAGVERLLKGEGDIEKQLQKALSFQGVFDDLAQLKDPTGFGLTQLDKEFTKLRDIFAEAGASTEEYAKLEELFQLKRTEIINEGSRQARELEIEIMRLTGDEIGALAAERAMEKEGLDATLSALIDRRNALIDEAVAAEQARAAADERRQLEYRMAQVLGDEEKILTMRREDELAAVSDLNKVYLQQVHAAEAAAAAVAKAAAAQSAAVSSLQGLPGMIGGGVLGAAGNPAVMSALGMFAGGDVTGARNALAQYISNTVGTALPGASSAVKSAAIDQVINSLSPIGGATNAVTTGQIAGNKKPAGNLSDGKLAQSFADAEAARVEKLDDLRSRLTDAYERERKALEDIIEPLKKIREQFADFKDELNGVLGGRDPFSVLQTKFLKTSALAATGDMDAMGALVGVSRDYLGAAKDRTGSLVAYQRFVATVRAAINQADLAASEQIDYNEEQLKALDKQVEGQIETNKKLDTIADLLKQLKEDGGQNSKQAISVAVATAKASRRTARIQDRVTRGGTAYATETVY